MATRSAILGRALITGGAAVVVFTVPAGQTWLVKGVSVYNAAAGVSTGYVDLNDGGLTIRAPLVIYNLANGGNLLQGLWAVAGPGDVCRAAATAFNVHVAVYGTKLMGVG